MATPEEINDTLNQLREGLLQLAEAVKSTSETMTDEQREAKKLADQAKKNAADQESLRKRQLIADEAEINEELKSLGIRKKSSGETEDLQKKHRDLVAKVNELLKNNGSVLSTATDAQIENWKTTQRQTAAYDSQIAQLNRQIQTAIVFTAAQADGIRAAKMAIKEKEREIEASKNSGSIDLVRQEIFQESIGKLKNQLDSTVVLTQAQYKEINAVEQSIRERNKEIDNLKNAGKNLASMVGSVKDVSSALEVWKRKQLEAAEGNASATAGIIAKFSMFSIGIGIATNAFDLLVAGIKGYYEGMLATQRALYAGERGEKLAQAANIAMLKALSAQAKASSDNLINLGKEAAAAGLAIAFMIPGSFLFKAGIAAAGLAIGAFTAAAGAAEKVAGELAERQAEVLEMYADQMDTLFNGFSELGKASMIGARGMEGLYDNLHKVGFTVKEFDKLNKVLQANTKDMKMFGVTASEGVDKFVEVAGELVYSELGHTLRMMGISTEEMLDHQAKYMAQQNRFGLLQNKTTEQLIKGTSDYIIELDKTAALTGASRKDQEESMKYIMANEKLRAGMLVEEEKANRTGDFTVLRQMERAAQFAAKLNEAGMKRYATGVAEYYGAGKTTTGLESAEAMAAFGKSAFKDINEGIKSNTGIFLQGTQDALKMVSRVAGARRYGAETLGYVGDTTGSVVDAAKRMAKVVEYADKNNISLDEAATELGKRAAENKTTAEQVKKREDARDAALKQDEAVRKKDLAALIDLGIFKSSSQTIKTAADKMLEAANKMLQASGLTDAPGSTPGNIGSIESQVSHQFATEREKKEAIEAETRAAREKLEKEKGRASEETKRARLAEFEAKQNADRARAFEQHALHQQSQASTWGGSSRPQSGSTASAPTLNYGAAMSSSNAQLKDAGLHLKSGDVQAAGSKVDPNLIEIAKQVQANIPGFMYFSGFNDQYHQENSPKSKHTDGLAFDFTVNPGRGKSKPSKEDSEKIISMLQSMGLSNVINEYDNPSAKATGGHFHAELAMPKAYDGGLFDGPKAGYPVELHGREAIVPLPDPSSKISVETQTAANKAPLNSVLANDNSSSATANMSSQILEDLYNLMEDKFDSMIATIKDGNDISDKLLKYSRV